MLKNKQLKKQLLIAKKNFNLNLNFQLFFNQRIFHLQGFPKKNEIIKINKFITKYSSIFPDNFVSYVKFPLQVVSFLSLSVNLRKFFTFIYDKILIKVSFLFIKLKYLNILIYYNSITIFLLFNSFLNEFFFDLIIYYKCLSFCKTLN
jgi:hypothetical protein